MFNQSTKCGSSSKFWIDYLSQSELNCTPRVGQRDRLSRSIYSSVELFSGYDQANWSACRNRGSKKSHGPIYDFCFSPEDGKLMIAGSEEGTLLYFDPLNHQLINQLDDAHGSSINYVKFLDGNLFATCSNDTKIALWDRRNAKRRLKTLTNGHSYYVMNLEYHSQLRYLVSSGFDGAVNVWDLYNSGPEKLEPGFTRESSQDCPYKEVLYLKCLMRMRMTSDHSKMVICTAEGYIMIIHDLDLRTLKEDLNEFQSDMYRLMQKKHSTGFDFGSWLNNLFVRKRNRVELIADFPAENEAHLIGSLDIHPQNWAILSRNLSRDENSEWTCVHNIQDYERPNEMMSIEMPKTDNIYFPHAMFKPRSDRAEGVSVRENSISQDTGSSGSLTRDRHSSSDRQSSSDRRSSSDRQPINDRPSISERQWIGERQSTSRASYYSVHQSTSSQQSGSSRVPVSSGRSIDAPSDLHISPLIIISARSPSGQAQATLSTSYRQIKPNTTPPKIFRNLNRMTHYVEEPKYKMFFKKPHFSACGRFIASPYDRGFRLLSFNSECSELSDEMLSGGFRGPQPLHEIKRFQDHSNYVTTANFSPTNYHIVSGCLNGQVNFYQPVL